MLPSLHQLLTSIVDYAGLFPPAQFGLPEAMAIYAEAQLSPHYWMLDRFVLPAASLPNWLKLLSALPQRAEVPKPLSLILSRNWANELEQIQQISKAASETGYLLQISALEVAPLAPTEILALCSHLPAAVDTFFEIPFDVELEPYLKVLHRTGKAAKLRTGGTSADAFPDSLQLGQRILALANAQISFKATAGLHHPLRSEYRLTYQPNSPTATMHGFLNLAISSALAYQQSLTLDQAVAVLESSLVQFQFTDTTIDWHNHQLSLSDITRSRQHFFRSFGSCSFQDPVNDLHHLKLL